MAHCWRCDSSLVAHGCKMQWVTRLSQWFDSDDDPGALPGYCALCKNSKIGGGGGGEAKNKTKNISPLQKQDCFIFQDT